MEQLSHQQQINNLAVFPQHLRTLVGSLNDAEMRFKPAENEWSVIENVGHLIDVEVLMRGRIGKIITTEGAPLHTIDVDASVREHDYQHKDMGGLLHSFAEQRAETIEQLRVLRPDAWERTGMHPKRGPMSIAAIVGLLLNHDPQHVAQIEATLAVYRAQP